MILIHGTYGLSDEKMNVATSETHVRRPFVNVAKQKFLEKTGSRTRYAETHCASRFKTERTEIEIPRFAKAGQNISIDVTNS